jgi:hopanoid biosynthesis associated protein HpnK
VVRLIVNADDFGLTSGVNRGILELHKAGVLPSTTLMTRARASNEAVQIARSTPTLGVGCHIVLADGNPTLPPNEIPSLVDAKSGQFPSSLTGFLARFYSGRMRRAEIEAEVRAQIQSLQSNGLHLTHIDTHKHTHMFPLVLRPILRAARACGIRAIRNPFEPAWAIRATHGAALARVAQVSVLRWLEPVCGRIIAEEGFSTTDGTIAVAGTGILDANALRALLRQIPDGTWELVTHPGYNDADLARARTRLCESRDIERKALSAISDFPSIRLISFAGLTAQ